MKNYSGHQISDNLEYFTLSMEHPEPLIDPNYYKTVERIVIPSTSEEQNKLTQSNSKIIRYISTVETFLQEFHYPPEHEQITEVLKLILEELKKTDNINYSAFCQFFNTHNINYSVLFQCSYDEQLKLLRILVKHYIENRHRLYLSHGYSDMVLQVMSDSYSHKRKGNYGAKKIASFLTELGIPDLAKTPSGSFEEPFFFLLADKTGKKRFQQFSAEHAISLSKENDKTKKFPDALIRMGEHYFIVEQKNMKESGGGQDKQTLEITDFIRKKPEFNGLHYITFCDGIIWNFWNKHITPKQTDQKNDIFRQLNERKENYFVNSYGFETLMRDWKDCFRQ